MLNILRINQFQDSHKSQHINCERHTVLLVNLYIPILEIEPVSSKRKTRSMSQDPHVIACMDILEESLPSFFIDTDKLPALLDKAVHIGCMCTLTQLEKLYSLIAQRIYHHRGSYNRAEMLQVKIMDCVQHDGNMHSSFVGLSYSRPKHVLVINLLISQDGKFLEVNKSRVVLSCRIHEM